MQDSSPEDVLKLKCFPSKISLISSRTSDTLDSHRINCVLLVELCVRWGWWRGKGLVGVTYCKAK